MFGYGIDLERFEVFTVPYREFNAKYRRHDIRFHDTHGIFGVSKFSYFVYRDEEKVREFGSSPIYLSICNKKSIENMNVESLTAMTKVMKEEYDIEMENVKKENLVVVAVDSSQSASAINESSLALFFSPCKQDQSSR